MSQMSEIINCYKFTKTGFYKILILEELQI